MILYLNCTYSNEKSNRISIRWCTLHSFLFGWIGVCERTCTQYTHQICNTYHSFRIFNGQKFSESNDLNFKYCRFSSLLADHKNHGTRMSVARLCFAYKCMRNSSVGYTPDTYLHWITCSFQRIFSYKFYLVSFFVWLSLHTVHHLPVTLL